MKRYISLILVAALAFVPVHDALANQLRLPEKLQIIKEEAFYGATSLDEVVVPYGTTAIESKAFANSSIRAVFLPGTVESIAEDAFEGADDVIIYAPSNTYVQEFAESHDYLWEDAGSQYVFDEFSKTLELYEDLEKGEGGLLDLESRLNLDLLDMEGITDEASLQFIAEFNAMQLESAAIVQEYTSSLNEMKDAFWEAGTDLEDFPIEYSEEGMNYTGSSFSYFVSSNGIEGLGTDFEITSVSSSEDGQTMTLEVMNNGEKLIIESSAEGSSISSAATSFQIKSRDGTLVSYQARGASNEQDQESIVLKALTDAQNLSNIAQAFTMKIENFLNKEKAAQTNIKAKLDLVTDKMKDPNIDSDLYYKLAPYRTKLSIEYDDMVEAVKGTKAMKGFMDVINPVAGFNAIKSSVEKWKEIGKIYDHGHPLPSEKEDPGKAAAVKDMLNFCRTARIAYVCNIMAGVLDFANDVSTLIATAGTLMGVTAPAAWIQKSAIFAITKSGKAILSIFLFSLGSGTTAAYNHQMATELDKLLHGGITGTVTNALTGAPVKRAGITCAEMQGVTNSKGVYEMRVPEGLHTLTIKKQGYVLQEVPITVGDAQQTVKKDIQLFPEITLSGVIKDSETGLTLSGVSVAAGVVSGVSNANGAYSMVIPAKTQVITFQKEGYTEHRYTLVPNPQMNLNVVYNVSLTPSGEEEPEPEDPAPEEPEPEDPSDALEGFEWRTSQNAYGKYVAELVRYSGNEKDLVVPSAITVDGRTYSVTSIASYAFRDELSLTSITMRENLTSIGYGAFWGCSSLESISLPASVTKIGEHAFSDCSSLTSVVIPDHLTELSESLFSGCSSLTSVSIPDGVTLIGSHAFEGCSSLTSVSIPDGVNMIGTGVFSDCTSLTSIDLPKSHTRVSGWMFNECTSLTSITIPEGVTSIDMCAFEGCTGLTSVTIPESVIKIDEDAFAGCRSLTNVTIPSNVTSIGDGAFRFCNGLTSITIPAGVTDIGYDVFEFCENLKFIYVSSRYMTDHPYWGMGCLAATIPY